MTHSAKPASTMPRAAVNVVVILTVAFVVQRISSQSDAEKTPAVTTQDNQANQATPTPATVTLRVTGAASSEGAISAAVFCNEKGFPDNEAASHTQSASAANPQQGVITMEIATEHFADGMPFAIAVYHDINNDGVMNKSLVGVPTEKYGFTNNARSTFGPPAFEEATLPALDPSQHPYTIDVQLK